jgi:small-conductance mechanosensitive channel
MSTLNQQFKTDVCALIDRHGCSHFVDPELQPIEQLSQAIKQLEESGDRSRAAKACLADLRKLLRKYEAALSGDNNVTKADNDSKDDPLETAAQFLAYLKLRWADEREYEDWSEYVQAMTKRLPAGAKNVKMTKRPFEVQFTEADGTRRFIQVKGREIHSGHFTRTSDK